MGKLRRLFFSFGSENDYDLINAKLREISQKYGEQIDVFRISSIVGYIKSDADRNTAYLKEAAIFCLRTSRPARLTKPPGKT